MKEQNKYLLNATRLNQERIVLCKNNLGGDITCFFSFYISQQNAQKNVLDRSFFIR